MSELIAEGVITDVSGVFAGSFSGSFLRANDGEWGGAHLSIISRAPRRSPTFVYAERLASRRTGAMFSLVGWNLVPASNEDGEDGGTIVDDESLRSVYFQTAYALLYGLRRTKPWITTDKSTTSGSFLSLGDSEKNRVTRECAVPRRNLADTTFRFSDCEKSCERWAQFECCAALSMSSAESVTIVWDILVERVRLWGILTPCSRMVASSHADNAFPSAFPDPHCSQSCYLLL
jgi:hypothetical protein